MLNPNFISLKLKQGPLNAAFDKIYAKTVVVIIVLIVSILKLVLLLDNIIDASKTIWLYHVMKMIIFIFNTFGT